MFPKNGAAVATNKKRITHVPTCVDLNTMGVTPRIKIDEQYLYLWFQLLDLDSISLVSAIPQISAKTMGAQVVMLPPLDLQEQFAAFVRQSDKSKLLVSNLMRLKKKNLHVKMHIVSTFGYCNELNNDVCDKNR